MDGGGVIIAVVLCAEVAGAEEVAAGAGAGP